MNSIERIRLLLTVTLLCVLTISTSLPTHARPSTGHYPMAHRATPVSVIVVMTTIPNINNGDGQCSLIDAMVNANADAQTPPDCISGAGEDTIELANCAA